MYTFFISWSDFKACRSHEIKNNIRARNILNGMVFVNPVIYSSFSLSFYTTENIIFTGNGTCNSDYMYMKSRQFVFYICFYLYLRHLETTHNEKKLSRVACPDNDIVSTISSAP